MLFVASIMIIRMKSTISKLTIHHPKYIKVSDKYKIRKNQYDYDYDHTKNFKYDLYANSFGPGIIPVIAGLVKFFK